MDNEGLGRVNIPSVLRHNGVGLPEQQGFCQAIHARSIGCMVTFLYRGA